MSNITDFKPEMTIALSRRMDQQRIKLEDGKFAMGTVFNEKGLEEVIADVNNFCSSFPELTKRIKFVRVNNLKVIYGLLRNLNMRGIPTNGLILVDTQTNPHTEEEYCIFSIEIEIPPNVSLVYGERISNSVKRQIELQKVQKPL